MRLLSDMDFYIDYNKDTNMWEVLDTQEKSTYGSFENKLDAFQYCKEMNE